MFFEKLKQSTLADVDEHIIEDLLSYKNIFIHALIIQNPNISDNICRHILADNNHPLLQKAYENKKNATVPHLKKYNHIIGNNIILRDVITQDAEFIVNLRHDTKKSRFISASSHNIEAQEKWIENYNKDNTQVYFIITDKDHNRLGTVRIYDTLGGSFCWGSWIIKDGVSPFIAIESATMIYNYAIKHGFFMAHFDVRTHNHSVNKFHKKTGAICQFSSEIDHYYCLEYDKIVQFLEKHKKYTNNIIFGSEV